MELILIRIVENMFLPPGINILMMITGFMLLRRFYRTGVLLMLGGFFSLIILSLPITAYYLNFPNNNIKPLSELARDNTNAKAIIILGGGRYQNAPEYNIDTVSTVTLSRIRYGSYLHKKTKLPVLVTGGKVFGDGFSEAYLMQQSLQNDFNVTSKWVEDQSKNTQENAVYSFKILEAHKIKSIILVTDVNHIKRATSIFEKEGFSVTAAPINFDTNYEFLPFILTIVPRAGSLYRSRAVLREYMGQLWYSIRY